MILLGTSLAAMSSTSKQTTGWQKSWVLARFAGNEPFFFPKLVDLLHFAGILRTFFYTQNKRRHARNSSFGRNGKKDFEAVKPYLRKRKVFFLAGDMLVPTRVVRSGNCSSWPFRQFIFHISTYFPMKRWWSLIARGLLYVTPNSDSECVRDTSILVGDFGHNVESKG